MSRRAPVLLALLAACAAPPPAAPASPAPSASPPTAPVTPEVARWLRTGGATRIGPRLPQGMLVLLGGRRALLRPDGSLETERAPAPESLQGLVLVPTADGDRLVGHGDHGVYTFAEPLGPATRLAHDPGGVIARIAAGPGLVAVWPAQRAAGPLFLDVRTGAERAPAGWPAARIQDVAFRTPREGAVLFAALGVAVTTDGGATFRSPAGADPSARARLDHLERRGDQVRAAQGRAGAALDLAGARLEALAEEALPTAPLLRWIAVTGADPLRVAIDDGIRGIPRHTAIVAASGLLARVRLDTGAVVELGELPTRLPGGTGGSPCSLARRLERGFVLCRGERPVSFPLGDDVAHARLEAMGTPLLVVDGPLARRGAGGGLAFQGSCGAEGRQALCVLGPDGKLGALESEELAGRDPRQLAPLADGRVAWLAEPEEDPADPQRVRLHFVLGAADGSTRSLPPFAVEAAGGRADVLAIEEAPGGWLRALLFTGRGVVSVRQPLREGSAELAVLLASQADLRDGRALARGEQLSISEDGGETWTAVPGPPRGEDPLADSIGANGLHLGSYLRVGWGGAAPFPPPAAPSGGPALALGEPGGGEHQAAPSAGSALASGEPGGGKHQAAPTAGSALAFDEPGGGKHKLTCRSTGDGGPALPLDDEEAWRTLFDGQSGPPPGAGRREISDGLSRFAGLAVRLEISAPDAAAPAPTRWVLRWLDPHDPVGGSGTATVSPPAGAGWRARVAGRLRAGRRVVALIAGDDGQRTLVDVPSRGPARVIRLGGESLDEGAVGRGDGDAVAFRGERTLFVWPVGGAPRVLAEHARGMLDTDTEVILGAPRAGGVPVLLQGNGWAALRTLPLAGPPGAWLPLEGWQPVPASRQGASLLGPCRGESSGPVFRTGMHGELSATLDGRPVGGEQLHNARVEVRLDGAAACLAAIEVPLPGARNASSRDERLGYLAVDLGHGTGRGIETGPGARVRTLRCALE
jgi:hypothetical protein